jgi:c-di-AMP phosphodiesterase-like protein
MAEERPDWIVEREQKEEESKEKVRQAVQTIIKEINCMGFEKTVGEVVIEEIGKTHRTLQQRFFADVLKPVILDFAKRGEEGWFDLRNEAACNTAKALKPVLEDSYFPFI